MEVEVEVGVRVGEGVGEGLGDRGSGRSGKDLEMLVPVPANAYI